MPRAKPSLSSVFGAMSIALCVAFSACVTKARDPDRGQPVQIELPAAGQPASFAKISATVGANVKGKPHTSNRPGTCTNGCLVSTTIFSVGRTKNVKPDVALARMQVIGEVINNDPNNTENAYKLKPKTTYLIWVAAASQPTATEKNEWGLFELPSQATGASARMTVGLVKLCHNYNNILHPSDANFYDCSRRDDNVSSHMQPAAEASLWSWGIGRSRFFPWAAKQAGMQPQPYAIGATWFECGSGCCTGTGIVSAQ